MSPDGRGGGSEEERVLGVPFGCERGVLRGETLRTLGREEEALRWYAAAMHASVGVLLNTGMCT